MNGVLGSLKSMLKRFRMKFLKKKKKEIEEIYDRKISKHSKFISAIYNIIALIYCPIGYVFENTTKKAKQEQSKLYKQLEKISVKLEDVKSLEKKDINIIEEQIKQVKNKIAEQTSKNNKNNFTNKLKEIEIKVNNIKRNNFNDIQKTNNIKNDNINNIVKSKNKKNEIFKDINNVKNLPKQNYKLKKENKKFVEEVSKTIVGSKIINENKIIFVKYANKELKNIDEKIKNIQEDILKQNKYDDYYDFEKELNYLRIKLLKLKLQYDEIKEYLDIEIDYDKYELCKSPKYINEMLESIDNNLKLIENRKKEIINRKIVKNKELSKENKQVKKKDKKVKENKKYDDLIIAQQLILNNIINQNKLFDEYMKKLSKTTNKKQTILSYFSNLSSIVLNFTISLFPFTFFKNKFLGSLVSSIMINNSIKTMRRILNPNLNLNYQMFIDSYYDSQNILFDIYKTCENSLQELSILKQELLLYNYDDVKNLLIQIEIIENNLERQMRALNIKKKSIEKAYVKVKKLNNN